MTERPTDDLTHDATNHTCANCGTAVSPRYHRTNRDERTGQLHACPSCATQPELFAGAHLHDRDGQTALSIARDGGRR